MRYPQAPHAYLLALLVTAFVASALWYVSMIPPGEGVDEADHFDYPRFIASKWRLPRQPIEGPPEVVMVHHPPLYYLLAAPLLSAFDTADREESLRFNPHFVWSLSGKNGWRVMLPAELTSGSGHTIRALYALRLLSVLLGVVALLAIYGGARLLLPTWSWAPLGVCAVACFNPSFIYMAATVHHDILLAALGAVGLLWCIRAFFRPLSWIGLLAAGVLAAAALLTKLSGLTLLLVILFTLSLREKRDGDCCGRLAQLALTAGVAGLLASPWLLRNTLLYGDPAGQALFVDNFGHMLRPSPLTWGLLKAEFTTHLERTYWGAFGFMHIVFPEPLRTAVWLLVGVALLGWGFVAARIVRGNRPSRAAILAWLATGLFLVVLTAFLARFSTFALGAWQGRYFLPAALTIGVVLVTGIFGFTDGRFQCSISLALFGLMLGYALAAPLRYVWPKYERNAIAEAGEVQRARPLGLVFDQGVELVGFRTSQEIVIPGEALDVYTYWRASTDASQYADAFVDMSVVGQDGLLLASSSFWPDTNTLPAIWNDQTIVNKQAFQLPADIEPGAVTVSLAVHNGKDGPRLSAVGDPAGGKHVIVAQLLALGSVVAVPPVAVPEPKREERFGDEIQLVASDLPDQVKAGGMLPVVLFWHVLKKIERDYTVFVHVLDDAGQLVAQLDRPPGGGASPTSTWRAGETLQDTYPVPLPEELSPGEYQVHIGLYGWPDLERLPASMGDAQVGDSVMLGAVTVGAEE